MQIKIRVPKEKLFRGVRGAGLFGEKGKLFEKSFPFSPKPPIPFQKLFLRFCSGRLPEQKRDIFLKLEAPVSGNGATPEMRVLFALILGNAMRFRPRNNVIGHRIKNKKTSINNVTIGTLRKIFPDMQIDFFGTGSQRGCIAKTIKMLNRLTDQEQESICEAIIACFPHAIDSNIKNSINKAKPRNKE